MLGRTLSFWFYPRLNGDPGRERNARTVQFACLVFITAIAIAVALDVITREPLPIPMVGATFGVLCAAAVLNRAGATTWAGRILILGLLLCAVLRVVEARDGFRSHAMLMFPGVLLLALLLLDRTCYVTTAVIVMLTVAALGTAEKHGLLGAFPSVRTPTSYDSIFLVDLTLLVFSIVGSRIVRDVQSNVAELRTVVNGLSAANLELTKSARALEESERKYRRLYESITDAVVAVDMTGHIIETNPAYEAMLGYTGEELRRLTYQQLTPESWHDFEANVVAEQILANGCSEVYEKEYRRRDGMAIPVELRAYLLRNEKNQPAGMWAIVHNITERRQAEASLRESERRYREVFDSFSECIFVLDVTLDGRFKIAGFNPAEERATGLSSAEVSGKFIDEVLDEDTAKRAIGHYRHCLEVGTVIHYDEDLNLPNGARYFHTNLIPVRNDQGRIYRIVGCCLDFTDLKRSQSEALARQKLESVGTLASGIAHDFNNLLGAVLAQAELALDEYASGASPTAPLITIQDLAIRGSEIVRQLMIYAGNESEVLELVNISTIVEGMLGLLKISLSKHALVETDLGEGLRAIRCRAAQLRQVVMNLVTNASEAIGDRDGLIRLTTMQVKVSGTDEIFRGTTGGDYVELLVSDTGAGMSQETQARVFDPFFTTKSAGRGLGLCVVHGIIRSLGGAIQIASEPGKGTTVRVLLPCAEEMAGVTIDPIRGGEARPLEKFTVLVVEDEDSLRQAVVKMLVKEGLEVYEASNGSAAIDLLHANGGKINLILLDMTIPGTAAPEVVTEVAKVRPGIKVILTSAYSQEMFMGKIDESQIFAFIRKPFRFPDLLKILQMAVPV